MFARPVKRYSQTAKRQVKMDTRWPYEGLIDGFHQWYDSRGGVVYRPSCPWGSPGDILWIKEKFAIECPYGPPEGCDNPDHVWPWYGEPAREMFTAPWRPAITMPHWASKRELRVLKVRVEQVESISEIDAQKLGWFYQGHNLHHVYDPVTMDIARQWFRSVWDTVYGEEGWGLPWGIGPWAWFVEFRHEQAQIAAA